VVRAEVIRKRLNKLDEYLNNAQAHLRTQMIHYKRAGWEMEE